MEVSIPVLREVTDLLLRKLEDRGLTVVDLDADYYWEVPKEGRYDSYDKPTEFVMGQLSEDWGFITDIARGDGEPLPYALVWAANLLKRIGERVVG